MTFNYNFNNGTTGFELKKLSNKMKIKINIGMKDNINIKNKGAYIINLESNKDNGRGSHWVALYKFDNLNYLYYDSFGVMAPKNIIDKIKFNKDVNFYYNITHIQDFNSNACGFYSLLFLYYVENYKNEISISNIFELINGFNKLFSTNTLHNDNILYEIFNNIF